MDADELFQPGARVECVRHERHPYKKGMILTVVKRGDSYAECVMDSHRGEHSRPYLVGIPNPPWVTYRRAD